MIGVAQGNADILVGVMALAGVAFSTVYSRKAAKRSKTSNGKTQAQIVEETAEKVDVLDEKFDTILLWMREHSRYHERDHTEGMFS